MEVRGGPWSSKVSNSRECTRFPFVDNSSSYRCNSLAIRDINLACYLMVSYAFINLSLTSFNSAITRSFEALTLLSLSS